MRSRLSPYPGSELPRSTFLHRKRPSGVRDLLPIFVAIWFASVVRLAVALVRHETFGGELIVVFLTAVLIPVLLFSARLAGRS